MLKKKNVLFLILLLLLPVFVQAKVAEAGDKVTLEGEYDSTKIVAGNDVENKASIDGIALFAGNNVKSEGTLDYGAIAGNNITISGKVNHDLFVAGNDITIDKDADIARDVFIAGNTLEIKTNLNRNLYYAGTFIDLSGVTINGNAIIYADSIKMDDKTVITGKLTYSDESSLSGLDDASIGSIKVVETKELSKEARKALIVEKVKDWIFSLITGFVTMALLFYLFPKIREKLSGELVQANDIAKASLKGLCVLVVVPLVCLFTIFTRILTPLSLLTVVIYAFGIYFSTLFVSFIVGRFLYAKFGKESNSYIELIIGLLVVKIVSLIPIIGGLVKFICLIYGLGIMFNYITGMIKKAD